MPTTAVRSRRPASRTGCLHRQAQDHPSPGARTNEAVRKRPRQARRGGTEAGRLRQRRWPRRAGVYSFGGLVGAPARHLSERAAGDPLSDSRPDEATVNGDAAPAMRRCDAMPSTLSALTIMLARDRLRRSNHPLPHWGENLVVLDAIPVMHQNGAGDHLPLEPT